MPCRSAPRSRATPYSGIDQGAVADVGNVAAVGAAEGATARAHGTRGDLPAMGSLVSEEGLAALILSGGGESRMIVF